MFELENLDIQRDAMKDNWAKKKKISLENFIVILVGLNQAKVRQNLEIEEFFDSVTCTMIHQLKLLKIPPFIIA